MKLSMYSIYDKVAQAFNKPFTEINDATAIRGFAEAVKDAPFKDHYELYNIGDFTDHNGKILSTKDHPTMIYTGFDVKTNNIVEITNEVKQS